MECLAIYRIGQESITHTVNISKQIRFKKSVNAIRYYFLGYYNIRNSKILYNKYRIDLLHYLVQNNQYGPFKEECLELKSNSFKSMLYKIISFNKLLFGLSRMLFLKH